MSSQNKGDEVGKDFKSKFLSDAEVMKEQLDSVSPTMCLAKWKQVSLHLTTGKTNSCYHPPLHDIDVKPLTFHPGALHNTEQKKQARKQMLEGTRPDECSYCWNIEDEGKLSDRHYRSGEPWAAEAFKEIVDAPWDQDVIPSYVEVNFNHNCNLRCSYCSPQYSTAWEKETNEHGAWPTSTPHNDPKYFQGSRKPIPFREHNPYVEAFWEWWPDLYPELKHFRMTGGEPMMDKNTYRVFDHVLANPKPDLHLSTTSNFSVSDKLWKKYLGYVKEICAKDNVEHFMQYVSVDAFGDKAEYIRDGLDFNLLWERVNQFLVEVPERSSITFIITMNNLNVTSLGSLLAGINGLRQIYSNTYQRVWFDTPLLRTPEWQSMQILPESYCDELEHLWAWMFKWRETEENRFKGFKDYEQQRLDRDIAWMRSGQKLDAKYLARQKADFYKFFTEHDKRRGTNFLETFPEMKSFWRSANNMLKDKCYHKLECDNLEDIQQETMGWVEQSEFTDKPEKFLNEIDPVDFIEKCPSLVKYTSSLGLKIRLLAILIASEHGVARHTDHGKNAVKLLIPISNTKGTTTEWYVNKKRVDQVEVNVPMIFNGAIEHKIVMGETAKLPRITLVCCFETDVSDYLK